MKTAKFLGVTTLAGALLFTGATAHHNNEAHADENYKLVLPTPDEWQKRHDEQVAAKAKAENPNQAGEGGGPGAITTNVNSYREYVDNNLKYGEKVGFMDVIVPKEGQEFLHYFKDLLESVEVVAISGSLPAGLEVQQVDFLK